MVTRNESDSTDGDPTSSRPSSVGVIASSTVLCVNTCRASSSMRDSSWVRTSVSTRDPIRPAVDAASSSIGGRLRRTQKAISAARPVTRSATTPR